MVVLTDFFAEGFVTRANTPHLNPLPQGERRGNYRSPKVLAERRASKTCNLRNEAICNVEEIVFMRHGEKELRRLQKNDKWLRFFGNEGSREVANTPHPNPLPQGEREKATSRMRARNGATEESRR